MCKIANCRTLYNEYRGKERVTLYTGSFGKEEFVIQKQMNVQNVQLFVNRILNIFVLRVQDSR